MKEFPTGKDLLLQRLNLAKKAFERTAFIRNCEEFEFLGKRTKGTKKILQDMRFNIQQIPAEQLTRAACRDVLAKLTGLEAFSKAHVDFNWLDATGCSQSRLDLETEFGAIEHSGDLIRSIREWADARKKGE
ncbi:hypothetical protein V5279_36080 [Bradyrhizobium sp. 26S5]|uniref:hypothetical protein n=1 Tax=Bradyrhizobium sp. 26S5 TaxID=3139729 RepID=UPI0030CB5A26